MGRLPASNGSFWDKVEIGPLAECWNWGGALNRHGYGKLTFHQRDMMAHRLAFELCFGQSPECVCHRCDNPRCCNPSHLFGGSPRDNSMDRDAKKRGPQGSRNPRATLTESEVSAIRDRAASGERQVNIARDLRLTRARVSSIVRGRQWVGAGGMFTPRQRFLSAEEVCEIAALLKGGARRDELQSRFQVGQGTIARIAQGAHFHQRKIKINDLIE